MQEIEAENSTPLRGSLKFAMALGAGAAVANIYYNQPLLEVMRQDLQSDEVGWVPTVTQVGYATGLFFLLPLGDVLERRSVIVWQFLALSIALLCLAIAPSVTWVLIASLLVGFSATVAQQIIPFASHLSPPPLRGATVGVVMSGVLTGILLSRTVSGILGHYGGWRLVYFAAIPVALAIAALMRRMLPTSQNEQRPSYPSLLASLLTLWRALPDLRLAAVTQAFIFAAFIIFWTILAFRLEQPDLQLGSDVAGLFGLLGAIGVLAAPIAGRIADARGPQAGIILGAALTFVAWIVFALWNSLVGMIVGVLVLDFAVQAALVSNQSVIFRLLPEARSRINTIFVGLMFLGGALGSALANLSWQQGQWTGACIAGLGMSGIALFAQVALTAKRTASSQTEAVASSGEDL